MCPEKLQTGETRGPVWPWLQREEMETILRPMMVRHLLEPEAKPAHCVRLTDVLGSALQPSLFNRRGQ